MNKYFGYAIQSYWGPRCESAAQCSARYWRMLESLSAIDPAFSGWQFAGRTRFWPMPASPGAELARLIEDCVGRDDYDEPDPPYGYWFGAGVRPGTKMSLTIHVNAGSWASGPSFAKHGRLANKAPE
jgi:hypothetical protein